jgi:hypothetical protein
MPLAGGQVNHTHSMFMHIGKKGHAHTYGMLVSAQYVSAPLTSMLYIPRLYVYYPSLTCESTAYDVRTPHPPHLPGI